MNMNLTSSKAWCIRHVHKEDLEDIYAMESKYFNISCGLGYFKKAFEKDSAIKYFVLEFDGKIVGYCSAMFLLEEIEIINIAILSEFRSLGMGKALIRWLIDYALCLGLKKITLEVRKSNIIAQQMYLSCGFKTINTRKKYYKDNNEDALIMQNILM